jgi:trimethylamine:corrinoid methyltransferase-like protein
VRFDREPIAELVAKAPAEVTLIPRNPARRITRGGMEIAAIARGATYDEIARRAA